MIDEQALAKAIQVKADELHDIGEAISTTNALRGRRLAQIARELESLVRILKEQP